MLIGGEAFQRDDGLSCRHFVLVHPCRVKDFCLYEGSSIIVVIQAIGKSKGRKDIRQGVYER